MTAFDPSVTHKVTKTEVVRQDDGQYAVRFEFDDGYTDVATAGDQKTAEFYAAAQLGEDIVMGVHPLLLNPAKAEALRRPKDD